MFNHYLKIAWRNIKGNKAFTTINVLGLTLGITACLIIYLITSFELSFDDFHQDKERIYRAVSINQVKNGDKQYAGRVPNPVAGAIRTTFTGVEAVAVFHNFYTRVTIPNGAADMKSFEAARMGAEPSEVIVTEPDYFNIIRYQWLAGNLNSFNEPGHVVITESQGRKYFGSMPVSDMMGKEVVYSDSLRLTVSGIVKDFGRNSGFIFKDFISFATVRNSFLREQFKLDNWHNWSPFSQTFVKLTSGTTPAQFNTQMNALVRKQMDGGPDFKVDISLQPLTDIHFNSAFEDAYSRRAHLPTLYGLMGIAVFILMIASINFINLTTARSLHRAKEIGIRKVLGSSRAGLIFQFLGETAMLTLFAAILSLIITQPVLSAFHAFIPEGLSFHFGAASLLFILAVVLVTALLAGLYPAKVLSSYLPASVLKGAGAGPTGSRSYLRKSLIVFQFTISLVLIIGSLVIGRQINYVLNTDMGFTKDAIITIPTNFRLPKEKKEVFAAEIRKLGGIQTVSTAIGTPIEKKHSYTWIKCAAVSDNQLPSEYQTCDENYVGVYQLKLLAGRNIAPSDTMREFLINEICSRKLGFATPQAAIGQVVEIGTSDASFPKKGPIAGVVADFHSQSLHEAIAPTFITESSAYSRVVSIKLATTHKEVSQLKQTTAAIEKIWKSIYPNEKFEYAFFDETVARFYDKEQKTEEVINAAMAIAIFISCMGLFGLATFTTHQRKKEIGIRKVLGARVTTIVSMLSKDFLMPVVIAIVIASPIAYYFMTQWLQDFAYRINISWWLFVFAGIGAIVIALATVSFQAFKAATTNPVKSLKEQ